MEILRSAEPVRGKIGRSKKTCRIGEHIRNDPARDGANDIHYSLDSVPDVVSNATSFERKST
ncbi:hypothetical protein [Tahibacter sp.]|uniref:hypothetical protein n=1 Tax=Tahibacter sp. TaxID=2056211 RepID=UPI002D7E4B9B|nr:hypothetical protein [Tahibacter sp.]